jgi:hypothetical protein
VPCRRGAYPTRTNRAPLFSRANQEISTTGNARAVNSYQKRKASSRSTQTGPMTGKGKARLRPRDRFDHPSVSINGDALRTSAIATPPQSNRRGSAFRWDMVFSVKFGWGSARRGLFRDPCPSGPMRLPVRFATRESKATRLTGSITRVPLSAYFAGG